MNDFWQLLRQQLSRRRPGLAKLQRLAQHGILLGQQLRRRDKLIYSKSSGHLLHGGGPFRLHYLGRQRFAADFLTFFVRPPEALMTTTSTVVVPAASDTNTPLSNGTLAELEGLPANSTPAPQPLEQVLASTANWLSFWLTRRRVQRCPVDADLLVVDQFLAASPANAATPQFAPFINAYLPLQATLEAQLERIRSKGHRRKLQATLKESFAWRYSRDAGDFKLWYDTMYRPFVKSRFQDEANVVDRPTMMALFQKRGFLLLLEEQGKAVSGALLYTSRSRPKSLHYWKYALLDADHLSAAEFGERNAKTEAMVLRYAVTQRYAELDFGLTRALPKDGIFVHKKRVGCDFRLLPSTPRFLLYFKPQATAHFLSLFPLLVAQPQGFDAWLGYTNSLQTLRPAAKRALEETLTACQFPALRGMQLFAASQATQASDSAASAVQQWLAGLQQELGCPLTLRAPCPIAPA